MTDQHRAEFAGLLTKASHGAEGLASRRRCGIGQSLTYELGDACMTRIKTAQYELLCINACVTQRRPEGQRTGGVQPTQCAAIHHAHLCQSLRLVRQGATERRHLSESP